MKNIIRVGHKTIGEGYPVFIIAEAGVNHNGKWSIAKRLVREAAMAGADCVKFQTFKAERVVTVNAPKAAYQLETTNALESQLDMLKKIELKPEYHARLKRYAEKLGLIFISTPYNFEDVDLLEKVKVSAYKVASGQIVEGPFLKKIARTCKPIFLSTGMATMKEVGVAVKIIKKEGNDKLILLQCTTDYPSKIEDANVRAMRTLEKSFKCLAGYSDHTVGSEAALAAVALGAKVIEKHFTLDKDLPGPDHSTSMTPAEFKEFARKIRLVEKALGDGIKRPSAREVKNAKGMRRSAVAAKYIGKGEAIEKNALTFKRPATGLRPEFYYSLIGKRARKDIAKDEVLKKDMVEWRKR